MYFLHMSLKLFRNTGREVYIFHTVKLSRLDLITKINSFVEIISIFLQRFKKQQVISN